jgi:hypothetical protein
MSMGVIQMSKVTVTRLFIAGIVAVVAGLMLALAAVVAALAGGGIVIGGPAVVEVNGGPLSWALVGLVIALVAITGGAIAGLVSWIGALLNTMQLDDKTWFVLLLVLGVFRFGFVAMIAYVLAGPDGTAQGATPSVTRSRIATTPDS